MNSYYYDLPDDMIKNIESFLKIKPEEIKEIIENPPDRYVNILHERHPFTYPTPFQIERYGGTQGIIEENNRIKLIHANLIKFFIEFDIKSEKDLGIRKALKYNFVKSIKEDFYQQLRKKIPSCDHVRQYITYDKKNIILSSPYDYADHDEEHFKYNFKKHRNYLYNQPCTTYYLVLK